MKKLHLIIVFCFTTLLSNIYGQVLVRCSGGFFRCVPTEESAIDSIYVTPCDCDEPRNTANSNYCLRTINICTDSLIYPVDIDSFDFPYYALDPGSMQGLYGPNLQLLAEFIDPTGTIDPFSSADAQEAALVLEIDANSKCASFDAWIPMNEEQTIKVFRDVESGPNDFDIVTIPASGEDCNKTSTTCYTLKGENLPKTIPSGGNLFTNVSLPIYGEVSKVSIKNINITHGRMDDLKIEFTPPWSDEKTIFRDFSCTSANMDVGFAMTGSKEIPCPPLGDSLYMPLENFYNPYNSRYLDDPEFPSDWLLSIRDEGTGSTGTLNSWELEVCVTENKRNVFVESNHAPIPVPVFGIVNSVINITQSGIVSSIGIEKLNIDHPAIQGLKISLEGPMGDKIVLIDSPCENDQDNLTININANAFLGSLDCENISPRPPSRPVNNFNVFYDKEVKGIWKLIVEDNQGAATGMINSWALNIGVDCIDNYTSSSGNPLRGTVVRNFTYQVSDTISSDQRVINNGFNLPANVTTVNYKAGKSVKLQNEFQVEQGQIFQASIEDCPNN